MTAAWAPSLTVPAAQLPATSDQVADVYNLSAQLSHGLRMYDSGNIIGPQQQLQSDPSGSGSHSESSSSTIGNPSPTAPPAQRQQQPIAKAQPSFQQAFHAQAGFVHPGTSPVGWGGQAIQDSSGFRVPWFGRNRSNSQGRGRGRGRAGSDYGQRNGRTFRKNWGCSPPAEHVHVNADNQGMTIEELVQFLQGLSRSQPIPDSAYQALFHYDSRATASLLKELSKAGLTSRAAELFDWLRKLEPGHPLHSLCDVYTYTAMISMCIYQQAVDRAIKLAHEMADRGVERNVHTYTALMNVCIKCGKCQLALETYHQMRQDGCTPNVVTYNTLIDVYGKMQQWEQAVKVLTLMKNEVSQHAFLARPYVVNITATAAFAGCVSLWHISFYPASQQHVAVNSVLHFSSWELVPCWHVHPIRKGSTPTFMSVLYLTHWVCITKSQLIAVHASNVMYKPLCCLDFIHSLLAV